MDSDEWFPLSELTMRLGGLVWVESQLAELYQLWSQIEAHAPAAVFFATAGSHHSWHAEVVGDCLPTSPALGAQNAIQAPTKGWRSAISILGSLTGPDTTTPRLKAINKFIDPWLDREIGALVELARPVSDAPMMRWLRFVSIDHHDDGDAVSAMLAARSGEAVRFDDHVMLGEIDLTAD